MKPYILFSALLGMVLLLIGCTTDPNSAATETGTAAEVTAAAAGPGGGGGPQAEMDARAARY